MSETSLPLLIQSMQRSQFYPHPVTEPIQLIQTHVSYVLLTGDFVYKVKKPVNFGFLDFSTLEKRHHFCQEELRLNQRGAGDLYLEVLPITQSGEQFQLGGDGQTVEYAVKMRQFPQDTLLSHLFEQGNLTEAILLNLAKTLADFHQTAPTSGYVRSFGEIPQVRQSIDENYDQTVQYIGGPQTQSQFDETKAYTDRFFAERHPLFASRIQHNWIRECHGDVHLRNIALWQDKLWLFDCIEFNEPFRFVDVMFDVAYIIMDLDVRKRSDLSTLFLNAYIEQTGDWEGLQVLPIYLSRQSYVRAKVTSFLLGDPSLSDAARQQIHDTAASYYTLAWQYTRPKQGQLILMSGLSGSGKTTTARLLARQSGAIHIRSDAVRKHLAGIPLQANGGDELYTPEMSQKTYAHLLELGISLAAEGYAVILDAKYDRQATRSTAIAQAQAQALPLKIVHCTAPLEVLQSRLKQRQGDISDATMEVLQHQNFEVFTEIEQPFVKIVNTTQELEAQLKQIV
ncbi:MAG: AAA family ATPase [Scytolyngbya sp. HA4215-MV1]|jgi:hypothetical protein|nr:AAA family ATPase [Scytolyngbya sp. HA4215-MV1]